MFRTLRFYHSFFEFLSTPSARRATGCFCLLFGQTIISIHALREEGDQDFASALQCKEISIHALREEGDAGTAG